MTNSPAGPIEIRTESQASVLKTLAQLRDQIRKRAFELYRQRVSGGADKADWLQAEKETELSHIAGIENNAADIRITAAIPDIDPSRLSIAVLPGSIVVQGVPANATTRKYSVFPLDTPINPSGVTAQISNGHLTIVAPKAEAAAPDLASAARPAGCCGKCAPGPAALRASCGQSVQSR